MFMRSVIPFFFVVIKTIYSFISVSTSLHDWVIASWRDSWNKCWCCTSSSCIWFNEKVDNQFCLNKGFPINVDAMKSLSSALYKNHHTGMSAIID